MKVTDLLCEDSFDTFLGSLIGMKSDNTADKINSLFSKKDDSDASKPYIGYKTGQRIIRPVDAKPGSPFGPRHGQAHNGTDFPGPTGTPVKAPEDGVIKKTGSDRMNGNHVVITSGGNEHWLLHLSKISVTSGQKVSQGDVIGLSGNTGRSTGPHLHWELHVAGRPVDPTTLA